MSINLSSTVMPLLDMPNARYGLQNQNFLKAMCSKKVQRIAFSFSSLALKNCFRRRTKLQVRATAPAC